VRADLENDAADQLGVDGAGRLDGAARGLLDLLDDRGGLVVGELVGRGELDGETSRVGGDERVELAIDLVELACAALLGEEEDEVPQQLVGVREDLTQRRRALVALDLRVREQPAQLGHLVDGCGELAELGMDDVELAGLLGRLEERAGVQAGCDGH